MPIDPQTCQEAYQKLIGPLRETARRLGYALAVHGSLARDIDLIACPWTRSAVSARALVKALQYTARQVMGYAEPCQFEAKSSNPKYFRDGLCGYAKSVGRICFKSHGRRSWAFHLTPDQKGPYIDLSVMPRRKDL